ncbi:small ribosomal subunit protein uS9m-like [Phragmites australis]|uniref:small ribosomal subunit protein uS9m-like n=1 Tax=Phragmites australis TaxID=29695 RepID=UPI002D795622|nr:small ribosomal subunit protein uS9m-like [Phragmites australis]XP_062190222.1 small ribosomal subunit protein uS9m-like [Phragmites australis]
MLLRRLLHSSRHFRHGLQSLTPAAVPSSSSPIPFRRLPELLPSRVLPSPRLLSTSGRDDDGNKPWTFAPESGDPDPFAHEDIATDAGDVPPIGSAVAAEEPWAKGFRAEDGENGDVFEEIYKEAASAPPAHGEAARAGEDEQWTLSGEDEEEKDDPFAAAVLGEGIESEGGALDEVDAGEDHEAELKRQQNRAREKELMETLKGPNHAFGDLIAASGITEDMIDSLILLKDVRGIQGLPPLSEIEDKAIQKMNATSSRAEVERQKQEEIAKARVRQVDEKGRAYGTGKRKCSIARVWIQPGDGKFIVNEKEFDAYFPILDNRADLLRPFTVTKTLGLWDVTCTVKGGGVSGQVGAIRLGISRALQNWEPGLRPYLKAAGYLTRDSRVVERKKPGKAKARKSFQWVKR